MGEQAHRVVDYVLATESAGIGIWTFDADTGVCWATEQTRLLLGLSAGEPVSPARFEAAVHPEDRGAFHAIFDCQSAQCDGFDLDFRVVRPGGEVRWLHARGRHQCNSSGQLERITGVVADVTDRRAAEEQSRVAEARLRTVAEMAGLGFYESNFSDKTIFMDDRIAELLGLPEALKNESEVSRYWVEHIHPDDLPLVLEAQAEIYLGAVERVMEVYRFQNPRKGQTWLQHASQVARRDANGAAVVALGVVRDVTEAKRAEESVRDLSRRLIRAHEEERAMIARELHDDLTQRLALLAIDAGRLGMSLPEGPEAQVLRSIRDGLARLSEDVHDVAYQLHPSVLDELGLVAALRSECERFERRSGVAPELELDDVAPSCGRDASLALFRVAQEALSNVGRHSGATHTTVSLREMEGGLLVAVRDDGVGFDIEGSTRSRSIGLTGMRERMELVNGTLDIESAPGQGTTVIAWVPGGRATK